MRKSRRMYQSNSRQGDKKGAAKCPQKMGQTDTKVDAKSRAKMHKQRLALNGEQHAEIAKN
mgnify:CR=1 FL=1